MLPAILPPPSIILQPRQLVAKSMLPFLDARRCLAALVHARALGFRFLYDKQKSAKRRQDEFSLYTLIVNLELITYLSEFTINGCAAVCGEACQLQLPSHVRETKL